MNQKQILSLLQEAAASGCTNERLNQIQCELEAATAALSATKGVYEITTPAAGIQLVLGHLFVSTLEHDPAQLPNLFPIFAAMCGDREKGSLLAEIDWSVAKSL